MFLNVIKFKLLDSKFIEEYISTYQKVFNDICNIIIKDFEILTKVVGILL